MSEQFGNGTKDFRDKITALYADRARFIVDKDLASQKLMHASGFECIATDGKRYKESRWEQDIELENQANEYKFSVYAIEKIVDTNGGAVVYITRRCAGTNNKGKSFNTEIRLRDEWVAEGSDIKIQVSETISRRVWLNGVEMTIAAMRPKSAILMQGCGDYEK